HGNSKFTSAGVERLGIDELCMMDGPHGVRSEIMRHEWVCFNREEDKCTYLPTLSALAATFNTKLAREFGETLGSEARHRGKDIILGPGINVIRTPLCGRNFEYMSEDPYLISKLSPEVVKGIESKDVASCVKHFALNNQELDRSGVNIEVSERALFEIYLKGFYSAIIEGGASSVMGAYNLYNNQHLCHNEYLVNEVLKGKWGFKGVYLSDWAGCHDTNEAIFYGLDLEMGTNKPYNEYYLADAFLEALKTDEEAREILDDKVRRILRLMFSVNKTSPDRQKGEFNTAGHQKTAYDIASEAIVLLKNDDVLPIKTEKGKKILVVGPNATAKHAEGGSSSGITPLYEISPLEGIKNRFSDTCEVEYESGNLNLEAGPIPNQLLNIMEQRAGVRAFKQTAYANGEETVTYTADTVLSDKTADSYKIEFSVKIPESGTYLFKIKSNIGVELFIKGKRVLKQNTNMWNAKRSICARFEYAAEFAEGEDAEFVLKLTNEVKNAIFEFGWNTPAEIAEVSGEEQFISKVEAADYVIYCGGLNHTFDTEG
ncbi:MAG: glycoside hydrolase family 3 C-terminal domain-containing protein, partial [Clostridia bacterium]|nr:glycoside hydrolase family 3 C-terminal domain-containing protein [Clostridia bacterium]